jgi:hypothetical protein
MTETITTVETSTKIGTEQMIRTSQKVSILSACVESAGGNQLITSPRTIPMIDAMTPSTTARMTVGRRDASLPRSMSARILCPGRDERHIARSCLLEG